MKYKRVFKLPDFKNVKDQREFYSRAYATFCVGYMEQIKNNINIVTVTDDNFYDDTEKRNYKALIVEAHMPKFKIVNTDFSNIAEKERVNKIDQEKNLRTTNALPKEKEVNK